ncbi:MAG: BrnT family toxin [Salinisphaera sp.]|jgi:uncharacterized DUF497 family protein|nr:BrnT family toxin [Salinisphaera sp.]
MKVPSFEWDEAKNTLNKRKHRVSFYEAQHAFVDSKRVIAEDRAHSQKEQRYYCFGSNEEGTGVLTVRFTYRSGYMRIIGADYWRKGKRIYEQANSI